MKQKIICIGIISIFLLTSFSVASSEKIQMMNEKKINLNQSEITSSGHVCTKVEGKTISNEFNHYNYNNWNNNNDILDQYQNSRNFGYSWMLGLTMYGQSFIPSYDILTSVNVTIARTGEPTGDVILAIRESLEGEDITSVSLTWEDIPDNKYYVTIWDPGTFFDFPDISVEIGKTYYIILICQNQNAANFYMGYGAGTHQNFNGDPYVRGRGWFYSGHIGNWVLMDEQLVFSLDHESDWAFETYGTGNKNQPPNSPIISGQTNLLESGKKYEYKFTADDIEDGEIFYFIDWGDNSNSGWLGPYGSGEEIANTHSWDFEENNKYIIKAKTKDIFDEESNWGTLSVSMPRNREIQTPFLKLLEPYPILYQLLQRFLRP